MGALSDRKIKGAKPRLKINRFIHVVFPLSSAESPKKYVWSPPRCVSQVNYYRVLVQQQLIYLISQFQQQFF